MKRPCCEVDDGAMCVEDCFRRRFAEGVRKEAVRKTAKETGMAEKCVEKFVDLLRGGWQASSDVAKDVLLAWQTNYAMVEREHLEALRKDRVHAEACRRTAPEVAPGWDECTTHGCVRDFLQERDKMLRKGWFLEVIRRYAQHRRDVEREQRVEQQKHEAAMSVAATGACGYWSARDAIEDVAKRFDEPLVPVKRPKPTKVEPGQKWRWNGEDTHTVTLCTSFGTAENASGRCLSECWRMLKDSKWEYLGVDEPAEIATFKHRDPSARSVRVTPDPTTTFEYKPGDQREQNVAYAQRLIDACPEWAYPLGWRLAVMAVCEWCNNCDTPGRMALVWCSGRGGELLIAAYHEARHRLTSASALLDITGREPTDVERMVCDAYERGRR